MRSTSSRRSSPTAPRLRWLALETPNLEEVAAALHRVSRDASLAGGVISRIRKFLRAGEIRQEWIAVPKLLDELLLMLHTVLLEAAVEVALRIPPGFEDIRRSRPAAAGHPQPGHQCGRCHARAAGAAPAHPGAEG